MTRKDLFDKAKAAGFKIVRHIPFTTIIGLETSVNAWPDGPLTRADENISRPLKRARISPETAAKYLGLD